MFIGATAVVAVAVGGYLYFRHRRTRAIEETLGLFLLDDGADDLDAPEEGAWDRTPDYPGQRVTVLTPEQEKEMQENIGLKFKEDGSLDTTGYVRRERPQRKEEPADG